jgi:hypothetical protein
MEVHVLGEEASEDSNFDNAWEPVLLASKKYWVVDSIEDTGFVFQSKALQGMPPRLIDQWKLCDGVWAIDEEMKNALGIQCYTVPIQTLYDCHKGRSSFPWVHKQYSLLF